MKRLIFIGVLVVTTLTTFGEEWITVKKGQTLWSIAGQELRDPRLWPMIYELNQQRIRNPNLIFPGQRLMIAPSLSDVCGDEPPNLPKVQKVEKGEYYILAYWMEKNGWIIKVTSTPKDTSNFSPKVEVIRHSIGKDLIFLGDVGMTPYTNGKWNQWNTLIPYPYK